MTSVVFVVDQGRVDHLKSDYQGVHQVELINSYFDKYDIVDNIGVIFKYKEAFIFGVDLWTKLCTMFASRIEGNPLEEKTPIVINNTTIRFLNHYVLCYHSGQRDSRTFKENRSWIQASPYAKKVSKGEFVQAVLESSSYQDIHDYYMDTDEDIGFDIETNALHNWHEKMQINGFSLVTKSQGHYINLQNEPLSPTNKEKFKALLLKKKPWTYNCKFERSAIHAKYDIVVDFNDAYALCKADGSIRSLKENAVKYLNVTKWNSQVELITAAFEKLFEFIKKAEPTDTEFIQILRTGSVDIDVFKSLVETLTYRGKSYLLKNADIAYELVKDHFATSVANYPFHWSTVPKDILGVYCIEDSYNTIGIKEKLYPIYENTYPAFIKQSWISCSFESNGIAWDDKEATRLESKYIDMQCESLRDLIQLLDLPEEQKEQARNIGLVNGQYQYTDNTVEELKRIFNPGTTSVDSQQPFWKKFKNNSTLNQGINLHLEVNLTSAGLFDDVSKCFDDFDGFKTLANLAKVDLEDKYKVRRIKGIIAGLSDFETVMFKGFSATVIDAHFNAFEKYSKVIPDDPSTWTDQYRMLILLKTFKKINKNRSTYINGTAGRSEVTLCKKPVDSKPPVRIEDYWNLPTGYKLNEDEIFILNTYFSENSADTKRWSSGFHTIIAGSELRKILTPKLKTNLMCHADYSQMELRVLAAFAKEESMIKAFMDGADIHRFVASKVFNKPQEEIQSNERSFSKTASFGIVYGKSLSSFARDYMRGDEQRATELFDLLYASFPNIKPYIENCHSTIKEKGYCRSIFGDIMRFFDPAAFSSLSPKMVAEFERMSVNYPIQGTASHIGALAIYDLDVVLRAKQLICMMLGFTHDAVDNEFDGTKMFEYVDTLKEVMVDKVRKDTGIPVDVDWEVGINMYDNMSLDEVSRTETERVYKFKTRESTFNKVVEKFRELFPKVETNISKTEEKTLSYKDLYTPKTPFSSEMGKVIKYVGGEITLGI